MTATPNTIDHADLSRLVETGAVRGAEVIGSPEGWSVLVKCGRTQCTLAARRGAVRNFRKFETLVSYLKGMGISQYHVNAVAFDAQALKVSRARPDASARMRSAFEARAHTDWMRTKVNQSLADPRPNVSHEDAMASAQAVINARRRQHAK